MAGTNVAARGMGIAFMARGVWTIAADAAVRAAKKQAEGVPVCTSDTVSAIIIAAAACESFINELAFLLGTLSQPEWRRWEVSKELVCVGQLLEEMEEQHVQPTTKFLTASVLLPGEPLSRDSEPFQSFKTL